MDREDHIRERLEAASPGPWKFVPDDELPDGGWAIIEMRKHLIVSAPCHSSELGSDESDGEFVAAAHDDVKSMLDVIDCARLHVTHADAGSLKELREALEAFDG